MEVKTIIRQSLNRLLSEIQSVDYEIKNESELAHLFFWAVLCETQVIGIPSNAVRSEIRLKDRGRIDFGLRSIDKNVPYEIFLEHKVWARPHHVSHMSKANVATRKRNECIKDAKRLSRLISNGSCHYGGLLILERSSTHLERLLCNELTQNDCNPVQEWFPINRLSNDRHQEHLGLIWVSSSTSSN